MPVLVTDPAELQHCRGMRMGYAPLLALLEPARAMGFRRLAAPGSRGKRAGAVRGFIANVARAAGGLPLRSMPNWLRPVVGWLMPRVGPRGLEFARTRVEMNAAETVLHLRRQHPRRLRAMVPQHIWALLAPYGITPGSDERPRNEGGGPA